MKGQIRLALVYAAAAALVVSLGAAQLFAQALGTADAAKFIGAWTLGLDTPQGAMAMNLTLKDDAGKVAGQITSDIAPDPQAITDIKKDGDKLVLSYNFDYQGQGIPVVITIAPAGDKYTANFDFAGGQFVMDGTAVKK
jgi:hypothetical protein